MTVELTISETVNVLGKPFPAAITVSSDGGMIKEVTLAAAKVGQLTTRTDADTGELTMSAGHGITTGARLDVYWSGGSRRGMTVGTVATNQVPIDGGSGDDLPDNLTAVTAMVPQEEEFLVTGDNVEALAFYSQRKGIIVLAESDDSEAAARVLTAGVSSTWTPDRDATIPVAGADVAKAFFSHGDSGNTGVLRVAALFS